MQLLQGTRVPLLPAIEATLIFILMATLNIPCYYTNNNAYISEVSAHVYACLTILHFIVSQQALIMYVICPLFYIPLVAAGKCHHCTCCSIICCGHYAMLLLLHVAVSVCKCAYVCVIVCNVAASKYQHCGSIYNMLL